MARPAGVVRSSASVSDTKPTPRCSSSCSVASRSVTERPQRSRRPHQHYIDLSAAGGLEQFLTSFALGPSGANLTDLHADRPAASGGILPHGAALHRKCLLVIGGNAGVQAGSEHFRQFPSLAKNVIGFCLWRSPFYGHFGASPRHGRSRSFSAMQDSAYPTPHPRGRRSAPGSRDSSRASTPTALASVPRCAAAVGSDSRTGRRRLARRCESGS